MNEQVKNTFLAVAVGVVTGVGLLVGIGTVVNNSLDPVLARSENSHESQLRLERKIEVMESKINGVAGKVDEALNKIDAFDRKLGSIRMGGDMPRPPMPQMPPEDNTVYEIPVADSYVFGKADAPVTIVEFSDLQCPFCSRFHAPLFEAVKAYPNDVKVIFKNFPLGFHDRARPAAKAALAAGLQGKYYEMLDVILQNQATLTEDKFKEHAGKLGLNVDQFMKDLKDRDADFEKKLNSDMELGSKVNVEGTPTYYINGKKTHGLPPEMWKSKIDEALKDVKAGKK